MIGAWMLYSIVVTGIVAIAGNFAESACLLARRSTRTVWVLVLLGAVAIPISAVSRPGLADARASGAKLPSSISGSEIQRAAVPPTVQVIHARQSAGLLSRVTATLAPFDTALFGAWVLGSSIWLIILLVSAIRVRRRLTGWKDSVLDGVRVRVSDGIGPALAGLFNYRIVIPAWVADLSPEERAFVLEHEHEHARAHDPALIAVSAFFIVLMPWNASLWYVQRRLRMAVELDCDMRVLRTLPDVRAYGSLLINVGERSLSRLAPLAAFAEPISSLNKRIEVMASASPSRPVVRAVLYVATASVVLMAACSAPKPTTTISPADRARSLSLELAALLRSDPMLATNVVSPELWQALDSTLAAKHERDSVSSAKSNQPGALTSTVTSSRQFDPLTHRMKSQFDSLTRLTGSMHADIDTLRFLARQVEPSAFDSVSMPSSVAVGLVLGAHDIVLRHSSAPIAASGDLHVWYDTAATPNYTICCGLMKRLFPNGDPPREIQGVTIARVAGMEGGRRVVVIALWTTR